MYRAWRGRFYPADLPVSRWLTYYVQRFDTVEINNTFYRLPEAATFALWRRQLPAHAVMAVKASRYLTHMKRLRDPHEPIARLFERVSALGTRLGPVLYQLPGRFARDLDRLDAFLSALPRRLNRRPLRHVMEFRDPSWYVRETFDLLDRHDVGLCLHDKHGSHITEPFVGPLVYVRFHGTTGEYHGSYSDRQLDRWARRLAERVGAGLPVYAYFNNDPEAAAPANALTLRRALARLTR